MAQFQKSIPDLTPEQVTVMQEMYARNMSEREIANALNINRYRLTQYSIKLGLKKKGQPKLLPNSYTPKEQKFIRKHISTMTRRQIAAALGRPVDGVNGWCDRNKVTRRVRYEWDDAGDQILRDNYGKLSDIQIGGIIGITAYKVKQRRKKLNLKYSVGYNEIGGTVLRKIKGQEKKQARERRKIERAQQWEQIKEEKERVKIERINRKREAKKIIEKLKKIKPANIIHLPKPQKVKPPRFTEPRPVQTKTKGKRKPDHREVIIKPFKMPEGKVTVRIPELRMVTTCDPGKEEETRLFWLSKQVQPKAKKEHIKVKAA